MSAVMDSLIGKPVEPVSESPPKTVAVESRRRRKVGADTPVVAIANARARALFLAVLPPVVGIAFLVLIWEIVAAKNSGFPSPMVTLQEAIKVFSDPFYRKGPNDQGIGWNLLSSLQRVAIGFGLAAAVGIPLGFMIGRFKFLSAMFNPIISLLKPVSPLAWLPIGLLVFKAADPAAIWSIFICSIWPMIINTAVGVQR